MTLNVGDRVRVTSSDSLNGETGAVVENNRRSEGFGYEYLVTLDNWQETPFDEHEVEKIDE
jgi:hypothetical protein